MEKKCDDCNSTDKSLKDPNVLFDWIKNLTNKQIMISIVGFFTGFMGFVVVASYNIGALSNHQQGVNKEVVLLSKKFDIMDAKYYSLDSNVRIMAQYLSDGGHFPRNLAFAPVDTAASDEYAFAPICKKKKDEDDDDENRRRFSHTEETAFDNDDIETIQTK